ncbi:MAG: hypothetical protein VXV96_02570 [Bdellovibrionota bacterium]|nr:hypothetical protein [Bdellovibrionota bacterium]
MELSNREFKMKHPFLFRLFKDSSGFSLAEVMVAAGMLGVLSLGVSQLMQNSAKTEKRLGQQVNMISLQSEISTTLTNPVACSRTFGATEPLVGTPAGQAMQITNAWQDFNNYVDGTEHIFRGSNPEDKYGDRADWGTVIREYDGTINPSTGRPYGVYGDGSNTITVTDLKFRGYYNGDGTGSSDDNDFDVTSAKPIIGSNPAASIIDVVVRVTMTRGNFAQFEAMTEAQRRDSNARRNFGAFEINRFFKVRVRVPDASRRVERCIAAEDDQITDFCTAMGGFLDNADGLCKNIKIADTTNLPGPGSNTPGDDNDWSIASVISPANTGGSILAENHLAVGFDWNNAATKATGVGKRGDILAARDVDAGRHVIAAESVTAGTFLNVGTPANPAAATGNASFSGNTETDGNSIVSGNSLVKQALTVGRAAQDTSRNLRVQGDNLLLQNSGNTQRIRMFQTSGRNNSLLVEGDESEFHFQDSELIVHTSPTDSLDLFKSSQRVLNITNDGEVRLYNPGNATARIEIGRDPGNNYRPIVIRNQPRGINTYKFATGSIQGMEVPTKDWVRRMVFGTFYEGNNTIIDDVISSMNNYLQHKQADAVIGTVCDAMQMRTGLGGLTRWSTCSMSGGKCRCQTSNCSSSQDTNVGQPICGAIRSNDYIVSDTYMRAPAIYTTGSGGNPGSGNMRAVNIYATSTVEASGNVIAGNNVQAANNVNASNRLIAGVRVNAPRVVAGEVCHTGTSGRRYCYTKFGRFGCTNYGYMIGIAYGVPICARNSGGGTSWVEHP